MASAGTKLSTLLEEPPNLSLVKALLQELGLVAGYAKVPDAVGTSWAILALGKDPAKRGHGTFLVEAEVTYWGTFRSTAASGTELCGEGQMREGERCLLRGEEQGGRNPR